MPRRLKVFKAQLGFYEQVIAAPSRKAALTAWGAPSIAFAHGIAALTKEPKIVAAALARPGVVLKRPIGSRGEFKVDPELPRVAPMTKAQKRAMGRDRAASHEREKKARAEQKHAQERERKQACAELEEIAREQNELKAKSAAIRAKLGSVRKRSKRD